MKKTLSLGLLCCLASTQGFAGMMGPSAPAPSYFVSLGGGPVWGWGGLTQRFLIEIDPLPKIFIPNRKTQSFGGGELFVGVLGGGDGFISYQLGLAFSAYSQILLTGIVLDEPPQPGDTYFYRYNLFHTNAALKGRLLANTNWVQPYLSGGIGVGFDYSHRYINIPTNINQDFLPGFASLDTISFTYSVGAGLQKAINTNWAVGVGYEFSDWGRSNLSQAISLESGTGLKLNHFYTHQLLCSVTYAF